MTTTKKAVLSCDPGMGGAVCVLEEGSFDFLEMPRIGKQLDLGALALWIGQKRGVIAHAFIEQVGARPGQGVSTMFKFGRCYGAIEGIVAALGIPYTLVHPSKWTKEMHAGIEGGQSGKERSALAAARLFPHVDFRPSERCKKPHDGFVDCALLAEYGRRKMGL